MIENYELIKLLVELELQEGERFEDGLRAYLAACIATEREAYMSSTPTDREAVILDPASHKPDLLHMNMKCKVTLSRKFWLAGLLKRTDITVAEKKKG